MHGYVGLADGGEVGGCEDGDLETADLGAVRCVKIVWIEPVEECDVVLWEGIDGESHA